MRAASALLLLALLPGGCAPIHSRALVRQCGALHAGMSLRDAIAVVTVTKGHCSSPRLRMRVVLLVSLLSLTGCIHNWALERQEPGAVERPHA